MFKRKKIPARSKKPTLRHARLSFERLEDRITLHSGVTLFPASIIPDAAPAGIVNAPDGNLWYAEFGADRIGRITPTGVVTEFTLPAGRGPLNITVGADGNLWFTENTGDRIGRLNPLAGLDAVIQASIVEFIVPGVGSAPNDIASGPDGRLWFTQSGSDQIGAITTLGIVSNEFAVPGAGSVPAGITSGADGRLWFTEAGSGEIGAITVAGVVTEFAIPVPANGMSDPEDITSGPGGALFFTDFGRDQIGRITTAGAITQFNLPVGRGPQQIVALDDGDLYFTMAASGRIGRLPASALIPGRPTAGAPPLEEFDFIPRDSVPLGITGDANGDIWFTLNAGNAIGNFLAHLAQITVTSTGTTAKVFDRNLTQVSQFTPFPGFPGTFSVAVNDLNGNGVPDTVAGAGPGGGPHVKVFDGSDNRLVASFFAFDPAFGGGVSLGADDVNGDGRADILVGAGAGGTPHVKIIDGMKLDQVQANGVIADSALLANFFAFSVEFRGGVTLAALDFNADSRNDVIVGAGPGGGPHVKVIDAARLGELQADLQIANSALLASFFPYATEFRGGVFVGVGFNDVQRKLITGAGPGGGPHVKVVDGTRMNQVEADARISDSALFASFYAFDPNFRGGVRVAGDDLNSDGLAEIIVGAGPGGGPHVKVVDGSRTGQVLPNGMIDDTALVASFFTTTPGDPAFTGGVFVAADADHRDGPIAGPPGITITNSQRDINDIYVFRSPVNATNTVLALTVSPFSTATTPNVFVSGLLYDFRIANRDLLNTTDDLTFRATFGPPDPAANNQQDVALRALPAARFAGSGGVLVKGFTGQNLPVRGVGGGGTAQFRAAEQDDPFIFDAMAFNALLNNPTAVQGVVDGEYPRPAGTATNFFGPNVNTLALVLEIPSARLTAPGSNAIAVWARTEFDNVQVDRNGRPAINTALIPPVPRGAQFPIGGTADQNRQDRRNAFNAGHPRDDRANFTSDMVSVLTAFYPAGRPGGNPNAAQASVVAGLLLPDILVHDVTNTAGFGGQLVVSGGNTFLGGGRKLSDDVIDTELAVLTDDDLPAGLGGGPNFPALDSDNVPNAGGQPANNPRAPRSADDNLDTLQDGSDPDAAPNGTTQTNGLLLTRTRAAAFPYIGPRNPNPTPVPGPQPPP